MLSIIVAVAKNKVIGIDNKLPWNLPADLKYFSKITTGKTVLMGKNTYLSIIKKIGHSLPNRKNYVLSRTENSLPGAEIISDLNKFISEHINEEIFVIGGAKIYEQTISLVDRLYITEIDCEPEGNIYFPEFDKNNWILVSNEEHLKDSQNEYNYSFKIYDRK